MQSISPELLAAVKERLSLNYTHEEIEAELVATGYDAAIAKQAILAAETAGESADAAATTATASATTGVTTMTGSGLPSIGTLLQRGFGLAQRRLDLVALLSGPYLVVGLWWLLAGADGGGQALVGNLLEVVAVLLYLFVLAMLLYTATHQQHAPVPLATAAQWTRQNFLGLLWVYLLSAAVVWGGILLFLIPGIIVGIYLYLSQYVYAAEGARGFAAVLRSRELVYGVWWAMFGRVLAVGLIIGFITIIIAAFIGGVLGALGVPFSMEGEPALGNQLIDLALLPLGAYMTVVGAGIGAALYGARAQAVSTEGEVPAAAGRYTALAWFGGFAVISVVALFLVGLATYGEAGPASSAPQEELEAAKERAIELRQDYLAE